MASFEHIQKDFSGGEISGKLFMRDDIGIHSKSVNTMLNFIPTLQGTAVRVPGTRFFSEIADTSARIIPFLSQDNKATLIVLTPATAVGADDGTMTLLSGFDEYISNQSAGPVPLAPQPVWINFSKNAIFKSGLKEWWAFPEEYTGKGGAKLGTWLENPGGVALQSRAGVSSSEEDDATLSKTLTIPEDCTSLQFSPTFRYADNFSGVDAKYEATFAFGTAPFTDDIYKKVYTEKDFAVGSRVNTPVTITTMADGTTPISFTAGQKIYFTFNVKAIKDGNKPSAPLFLFSGLLVRSLQQREITTTVIGTIPYTADEIQDIHFIQSPYGGNSGGKEVVMVHPNHHPKWLQFFTGAYQFVDIPFTDYATTLASWVQTGYPATCTSFNGRLILAGSKDAPYLGSPEPAGTETVWGTEVGNWTAFSDTVTDITAATAIELTSIYRSPIQWVAGQKDLLVGAREMEYVVSADGIFQPSDIGVFMQSTHGSINVQPVGLGATVVYPAEGGTRVRSMNFQNDDDGYISPDLTFMNPTLCYSGIKRMVRMRNPQQMVVCLLGNGLLAILTFDPTIGVVGWSRVQLSGNITDICVLPSQEGEDVLFCTVERIIDGVGKLYIETFRDWSEGEYGDYVQCNSKQIVENTNVIAGLDHLEGAWVQVVGDNNYLGGYKVVGGSITLINQIGDPINVSEAVVGLWMTCRLRTLPLVTQDPGSKKRFKAITVRGVFSTLAEINGERVLEREPATLMGDSQPIDWFTDYTVSNLGFDKYQSIIVVEYVPFRTEVIGIFGKVQANSV